MTCSEGPRLGGAFSIATAAPTPSATSKPSTAAVRKFLPPGNNPTWLLGRHPIIRVRNRERTLLN